MKKLIVLLTLFCVILASCEKKEPEGYTASINAMDTVAFVRVYDEKYAAFADECTELMLQLEAELSVTLTGSRVYHLNKNGSVPSTEHLKAITGYALELKDKTFGAFDPCIYPLVRLWGFTEENDKKRVPSEDEIIETLKKASESKLYIKNDNLYISNGGAVDFGGIAKGYAAKLMLEILKENGVDAALIDLGGNIQTVGSKSDGTPWNIAIKNPVEDGYTCYLSLGETAVVTSGSDVRYFIGDDGKKYHHIIDPKTGYPSDAGIISVTVIHEDAAIADGLSTAFFVLGIEKSLEIAEHYGAEVVVIENEIISITKGLQDKFTLDESAKDKYNLKVLD